MKPKAPWGDAHTRLKRLYEERTPEGMTQKEFGAAYGIGSQSMVAQYLSGIRPLNYDAAARFARGLRCTIYDISPEMADSIKDDILPVLGRALRRAAMLAAFVIAPALHSPTADAGSIFSPASPAVYYVKWRRRLIGVMIALRRAITRLCAFAHTETARI